jgi:hypothetical protein
MKTKTLFRHLASAAILTMSIAASAEASFIVSIDQVGSNVVATGSGTINTAGLTADTTASSGPSLNPQAAVVGLGIRGLVTADLFTGESGPAAFGSGRSTSPSSGSGDRVALIGLLGYVYVPDDYTSGSSLSDTDTWDSTTISGLGLTPGTYTYTWGSGGNADSLTVDIQSPAPEPGTVSLLSVGVLALALNRICMRKRTIHT